MELQLVVVAEPDGEPQAFHFPDFERLTLGRGPDSPVPLDGSSLSREHLRFELSDRTLVVTDISSNGAWVNGKSLGAGLPRDLKPGDEVSVAGYRIRPRLIGAEPKESSLDETVSDAAPVEPAQAGADSTAADVRTSAGSANQVPSPGDFRLSTLEMVVVGLAAAVLGLAVLFFLY